MSRIPTDQNNTVRPDADRPDDPVPYMNTLTQCSNKMVKDGYLDTFKVVSGAQLYSTKNDRHYSPEETRVLNYYRFEGQSDPADNTILYQIETNDGAKGTLIDAYGPYSDANVNDFMQKVEDIHKKTEKRDHRGDVPSV